MRKLQMHLRAGAAPAFLLPLAALLFLGCAGAPRGTAPAPWRQEGIASWYGSDFDGRRTASGERYNMYAMTAAHKTLPLGTEVQVTHRETGRKIKVRINDRGPFVAGRIIDLSYAAAHKLGSAEAGTAPVIVEARLPPSTEPAAPAGPDAPASAAAAGPFSIQVGAFASRANADRLRAQYLPEFREVRNVVIEDNRGTWYRVRAGRFPTEEQAGEAARALEARAVTGFVVRED
jgi:rare lipoprotein A